MKQNLRILLILITIVVIGVIAIALPGLGVQVANSANLDVTESSGLLSKVGEIDFFWDQPLAIWPPRNWQVVKVYDEMEWIDEVGEKRTVADFWHRDGFLVHAYCLDPYDPIPKVGDEYEFKDGIFKPQGGKNIQRFKPIKVIKTPTPEPTNTPTDTLTATLTATNTVTPSNTPTFTPTFTPTSTLIPGQPWWNADATCPTWTIEIGVGGEYGASAAYVVKLNGEVVAEQGGIRIEAGGDPKIFTDDWNLVTDGNEVYILVSGKSDDGIPFPSDPYTPALDCAPRPTKTKTPIPPTRRPPPIETKGGPGDRTQYLSAKAVETAQAAVVTAKTVFENDPIVGLLILFLLIVAVGFLIALVANCFCFVQKLARRARSR